MPQYQPTAPTSLHTASAGSETQLRQGRRWLHFETLCGHFGISKASRKEGVGKSCHLLSTTFCVIIWATTKLQPCNFQSTVCEPSQRCITCTCCFLFARGKGPLWIPVPTKLFHNGGIFVHGYDYNAVASHL